MSIIPRHSPLNLQYRICVVTSASSALGVVICKTLLKANALVLGIDDQVQDKTLSSAPGTHFQFLQCRLDRAAGEAVQAVGEKFGGSERMDVLVCIGGGERVGALRRVVEGVMGKGDGGSVVHVLEDSASLEEGRKLISSSQTQAKVRCNVVVPGGSEAGSPANAQPIPTYEDAKEHMQALIKTEKRVPSIVHSRVEFVLTLHTRLTKDVPSASAEAKQAAQKIYDVANLTLFLAGDMSQDIDGKVVYADGMMSEA